MYIIMLVHACFLLEKKSSLCLAPIIFIKNSLCYLIIALVCNIFGLVEELFHNEMYSMTRDGLALALSRVIRYTHVSLDVI